MAQNAGSALTRVKGVVTERASGQALVGVTVKVKGGRTGTATDNNGAFVVDVPASGSLVFSYVGFTDQEVSVKNQATINIELERGSSSLNEVVVVGYGTQSKKDVIGSIASVSSRQLQDKAVVSFGEAIVGQVAGVQVQQTSSAPGAGLSIKIRGVGSISADNTPLYVIDGVPLDNTTASYSAQGASGANVPTNPLASINPGDIQSIDILKDASATSIYGSRGSNGVVIITTKQGAKGRTQVNLNVSNGWQNIDHKIPMLSTAGWAERQVDIRNYNYTYLNGVAIPGRSASDPNAVRGSNANFKIPKEFKDPSLLPNNDWQDIVYQTAPMNNYQLSASGGTDNARFYISGNYINQEAITRGQGFKKYSLRGNIDANITDRIKVGFRIAPSYSVNRISNAGGLSYYGGVTAAVVTSPPIFPVFKADGTYNNMQQVTFDDGTPPQTLFFSNGLGLSREYENTMRMFNTVGTLFTTVDLSKHLTVRSSINADVTNINTDAFVPSTITVSGYNLYGSTYTGNNLSWSNENTVTYDNTFNEKHHLNVLGGFSEQMATFTSAGISADQFPNNLVHTVNAGITTGSSASKSQWSMASLISRVKYDFNEKYFVTATFRRDGSSRFGANAKWGNFPSAAIGWRVSQEPFMQAVKAISDLKLRASYGIVGNDQIGNYGAIGQVGPRTAILGSGDGRRVSGLSQDNLGNSFLTWEQSKSVDIGLDAGLFKNRLNITVDYYDKVSSGMLFGVPVPTFTGFGQTLRNLGRIRNKGIELNIETRNIDRKNFVWTTNFNISSNKNKVEQLNANNDDIFSVNYGVVNAITHRTRVGETMASYYGFIYDGVYKNKQELAAGPKLASGITAIGDPRLKDLSGPGGKPDGLIDNFDKTNLGNNLPDFTFGFTNSVTYKNFDFTILIQGVQGVEVLNLLKTSGNYKAVSSLFKNYWKSEAEPGDGQNFRPTYAAYQGNNPVITSWLVEDGSFVRVKNLTLGYRLPTLFGAKVIKNARAYLNVQNLHTFTSYEGYNPEVNTVEGTDNLTPGMDFGTFPLTRTITLGLNLTF
ncbi:TonB-dependent receptor [Segetibacter sp.]|uniref:SusC/RagA family TonB-linked outer membrane protein n=1 Tax=Segetibacter sp. TaxID=2231182 RepID=UPI00260EC1B3|nr:TonB-dependent receptor [Segetibacter sp.]